MANEWKTARLEIKAYKSYINSLSAAAKDKASFCFLITAEEINRLLNQRGDGTKLNGIRVYLGSKMIEGQMIPTVHVVACEKDANGSHQDYNIPEQGVDLESSSVSAIEAAMPLKADALPCPTFCSNTNVLNS